MAVMNSGLKEYIINNICKKYGIDEKTIDFLADNDTTLHFYEQDWKEKLLSLVPDGIKRTELELEIYGIKDEEIELWNNERYSNYVTEERDKALEKIINAEEGTTTKEKFKTIREMVLMVSKGISNGAIIIGDGGVGKSYNVLKTLNEAGLKEDVDYTKLTTYSTPLEFYRQLYEHKDKRVILIDDVHSIWQNKTMVSILKAVLDDVAGTRIAQYSTTSDKKGLVPSKFIVSAGIIVIANELPVRDKDVRAVISRCHSYNMKLNYNETIELLMDIAKHKEIEGITKKDRIGIVNWLNKVCDASYQLSLRTLNRLFEIYQHDKENWKTLAKEFLHYDEDLQVVLAVCKDHTTGKEQVKAFREKTGKSRATFYNLKKKLKDKGVI